MGANGFNQIHQIVEDYQLCETKSNWKLVVFLCGY
jgi:hypothetical protein